MQMVRRRKIRFSRKGLGCIRRVNGRSKRKSQLDVVFMAIPPTLIREGGKLGRGDLRWTLGCVRQRRNLWLIRPARRSSSLPSRGVSNVLLEDI